MSFSTTLERLLNKMLRWFAQHDVAAIEQRTRTQYQGLGVRAQALNRETQRAVATWVLVYHEQEFNLEIWIDNLQFIDGVESVRKKSKLSTHAINVVRKNWNSAYIAAGGHARRSRREILFSEEAVFTATYSTYDESANIFDTAVRLLVAPSVSLTYFHQYHHEISLRDKRDAEILVAMHVHRSNVSIIYPHLRLSDWDTIDSLLSNPDVPKQLLYPPESINWRRLFTIVARYRLSSPQFVVFANEV